MYSYPKSRHKGNIQAQIHPYSTAVWDGWSASRPGRFTPGRKTEYPLYRRLGGPQGRSGLAQKIFPASPTGFETRTIQPSESHLTSVLTFNRYQVHKHKTRFLQILFVFHSRKSTSDGLQEQGTPGISSV